MDRKTLDKAWGLLEAARRGAPTADDLEAIATMLRRRMKPGGKHPVWVTDYFPHRPLPIARHGGNPSIPKHAKGVILRGLEADASAWEDVLNKQGQTNGGSSAGG